MENTVGLDIENIKRNISLGYPVKTVIHHVAYTGIIQQALGHYQSIIFVASDLVSINRLNSYSEYLDQDSIRMTIIINHLASIYADVEMTDKHPRFFLLN